MMKHRVIFVVLFVILTLFTGCIAANAESHPDTLTGAEFGTGCSWGITDDGTLYVWPTDGNSGVLPNNTYNSSSFWPWYSNASTITKVIIEPGVLGGSSCAYMFCNCSQLQSIDLYGLDVSSVISMSGMFYGCSQLQLIDIPEWDTSNLTEMSSMFSGCSAITTLDLSVLDTSHVTSISSLFYDCASLSSLDLSDFNTSSVIYMHNVFRGCSALESINLSGWDTSCATAMDYMFRDCIALSEIDVSHFDMSLVTSVRGMFSGCKSLRMIDLSKWNTPSLLYLTTTIESWHYMEDGLFSGCINLETVDVSGINTSNVTRLSDVFYDCRSLKYLDLSSWDVSNVTSGWGGLFDYCNSLEFLDISSFDVRNMKSRLCLSDCRGLKEIVLGEYNPFMGDGWIDYLEEPNYWDPSNGGWCKSKWIREDNTFGPYTSAELRENYTSAMAGKWVLEQPKDQYTVRFMSSDPVSTGSMPRMTCLTADDFVIPENQFAVYKGKFDHWEDDRGNVYSDRGIIHSGTYVKNNVVVLTAMYSYNDHDVVMQNGSFDFSIKADEKALFSPVPASTSYQVYEQTPFGWNLIKQVGNTGVIESITESEALFLNKYDPLKATVRFVGTKLMDDSVAGAETFSFLLYEDDTLIDIATVGEAGVIEFQPITYDRAGNHNYTIQEVIGNDRTVEYDTHVEAITVVVESDGVGHLSVDVQMDDDEIVFENKSKPGLLALRKAGMSNTDERRDGTFYYEVQFVTQNGQPYELASSEISYEPREGGIEDQPELQPIEKSKHTLTVKYQAYDGSQWIPVADDVTYEYERGDVFSVTAVDDTDAYQFDSFDGNAIQTSARTWKGRMLNTDMVVTFQYSAYADIRGGILWDDDGNIGGFRPSEMVVYLVENGQVTGDFKTVNSDETAILAQHDIWFFTFENMPTFKDGKSVEYSYVVEPMEHYIDSFERDCVYMNNYGSVDCVIMSLSRSVLDNGSNWSFIRRQMSQSSTVVTKFVRNTSYTDQANLPVDAINIGYSGNVNVNSVQLYNLLPMYAWIDGDTCYWWSNAEIVCLNRCFGLFVGTKLINIDLSAFDLRYVVDTSSMFQGCADLLSVTFGSFEHANVTDMNAMFNGCGSLSSVNFDVFDTHAVTNMSGMFRNCASFESLDLSSFDTGNVTTMSSMFYGCTNLKNINVVGFDVQKVRDMPVMFQNCINLTSIDLSTWHTDVLSSASAMFSGCSKITTIDLSSWDTDQVTGMANMFDSCGELTKVYVGDEWSNVNVIYQPMFGGCIKLVGGHGTTWNSTNRQGLYARVDNPPDEPGYFTYKVNP